MDAQLVDKIVHEVKSQGVFDEFRKDSMADVDTKPAYQNLRQRVENTVKKFLSGQKWTLETNKNQLREKLRRHITESGFLDVGVERIVDQVVNPKIGSVFQPRIEEIAYNYLGLPPPPKKFELPPPPLMHPLPPLPLNAPPPPLKVETISLLPTDLEQVSPDSDNATVKSEGKEDMPTVDLDTEEKLLDDEDESPPFEPLIKQESEKVEDDLKVENQKEILVKQECVKSMVEESNDAINTEVMITNKDSLEASNFATESVEVDKEVSQSVDARISQDSQLSSVSSDSRLYANVKDDTMQSSSQEAVAAIISEEAQMPKFNENSSELNATNSDASKIVCHKSELHFDIKKDEIKFEGTERKTGMDTLQSTANKTEDELYSPIEEINPLKSKNNPFEFSTNKSGKESKEENGDRIPNSQELSFGSSIEDSSSVPPSQTPKNSIHNKDNDDSPEIQILPQTARSVTPTVTPIPTPPLPTPTFTPSPVTSQKPDKYPTSASSKHRKHSKERRRSNEREKEKYGRERHRSSREMKDSTKYHTNSGTKSSSKRSSSSSSSKYSSSHNKNAEKDTEKSSSSSAHSSSKHTKHSHSHSSSSSNENHESRKTKRESDKRQNSSSSSSSKRVERKDDHAEAKHKIHRRKSTDSNDDEGDKCIGDMKYNSQYQSSYPLYGNKSSKSSGTENSKSIISKANDSQKEQMEVKEFNEESTGQFQYINNVVILNDILENPQTQYIQLNNKGHLVEMPPKQQHLSAETNEMVTSEFNNNIEVILLKKEEKNEVTDSNDLFFFDELQLDTTDRLKLINDTMDLCRSAVNSLRFDSLSDEETLKRKSKYNYEDFEATPRKRCLSNESECRQSKTSPTPSDTSSVNSKENEEIHKNMNQVKKSLLHRHKDVIKLSKQQRYSSDDLYKPRPILGQRSRRRGMDSLL